MFERARRVVKGVAAWSTRPCKSRRALNGSLERREGERPAQRPNSRIQPGGRRRAVIGRGENLGEILSSLDWRNLILYRAGAAFGTGAQLTQPRRVAMLA